MLDRLGFRRRQKASRPIADPAEMPEAPLVRSGSLVELRQHIPQNKPAFQRWYADAEIANLLRHDLSPLSASQSAAYFDSLILPLSQRSLCYAIHERSTRRLIGTTALTDLTRRTTGRRSALFRIVIGEKEEWGKGFGTEATRLVMAEAFESHGLTEVRLEVFRHNPRAIRAYERVGFAITGEHVEWVGPGRRQLNVIEMRVRRSDWEPSDESAFEEMTPAFPDEDDEITGESEEERFARIARRRQLRGPRRTRRQRSDGPESEITLASTEEHDLN